MKFEILEVMDKNVFDISSDYYDSINLQANPVLNFCIPLFTQMLLQVSLCAGEGGIMLVYPFPSTFIQLTTLSLYVFERKWEYAIHSVKTYDLLSGYIKQRSRWIKKQQLVVIFMLVRVRYVHKSCLLIQLIPHYLPGTLMHTLMPSRLCVIPKGKLHHIWSKSRQFATLPLGKSINHFKGIALNEN